jgi:endonuclease/exonuclease/phosphatase family metal-dependent hydrolase
MLPERRWVHAIRAGPLWLANLHIEGRHEQARAAAETARGWAAGAPLVLGGDFNLRSLELPGLERVAAHDVDYVFIGGGLRGADAEVLDSGPLSDHAPVAVTVEAQAIWAA